MLKNRTFTTSLHIIPLFLLASGALLAYFWFIPLGILLEVALWCWACYTLD